MPKRRIFIPNKGCHDYSAAESYGDLTYISRGLLEKTELGLFSRLVDKALETSKPSDYVLPSSFSVASCLLASAFARKHGKVNYLIYLRGRYVERTISYKGDDE